MKNMKHMKVSFGGPKKIFMSFMPFMVQIVLI